MTEYFPDSPRTNGIQKFLDAFAKFRKATISLPVLLCSDSGLTEVSDILDYGATSLVNRLRNKNLVVPKRPEVIT